jgi:tetratricopeptide (TPR) repeat protein
MKLSNKIVTWSLMLSLMTALPIHAQISDYEQKQFDNMAGWAKKTRYLWMTMALSSKGRNPVKTSNSKWIEWLESELETVDILECKISILYMLGKYEREEGNYRNSLTHLQAGLTELRSNPDLKIKQVPNHISNLDLVDELGQLYIDLRDYEKAEAIFNEALNMRRERLGKNNRALANSYYGLGDINFYQKNHEAAVEYYSIALDQVLNGAGLYGSKSIASNTHYRLSRAFYESGSYEEAIKNGKSALRKSKVRLGIIVNPMQSARSLNLLALSYLKLGDLENANEYYRQADELFTSVYSKEINTYTELLKTKASISWAENKQEEACTALEQMMDNHIVFIRNNFVTLTEKEKQDFFDRITEDQNIYFDYSVQTFQTTQNEDILKSILNRRLVTKGFILNDQNKIKQAIRSGDDETLKTALQEWQRAKEVLSFELYNNPLGTRPDSLRVVIMSGHFPKKPIS